MSDFFSRMPKYKISFTVAQLPTRKDPVTLGSSGKKYLLGEGSSPPAGVVE